MKNVTCKKCGWVSVEVSREFADLQITNFNDHLNRLPLKIRAEQYGDTVADIRPYERCFNCGGNYKNFRDTVEGDCPDGVTLQTIINRDE